jgi:hypothetical protein
MNKPTQKVWWPDADTTRKKANAAAFENWWRTVQARVREPLEQWRAYRYQLAIPLLQAARDHFDKLRIAIGRLSFSDLLVTTAKLLREKPAIRVAFAERHRFLLVDEFQDTDPIQAEIIVLLTAADSSATEWRTAKVAPGRLFVVGDPQQSIYRFRRADIDVFDEVTKRITDSTVTFRPAFKRIAAVRRILVRCSRGVRPVGAHPRKACCPAFAGFIFRERILRLRRRRLRLLFAGRSTTSSRCLARPTSTPWASGRRAGPRIS